MVLCRPMKARAVKEPDYDDDLLTPEETWTLLRVSRTTFFRRIRNKELLRPIPQGPRLLLYRKSEVIALMEKGYY